MVVTDLVFLKFQDSALNCQRHWAIILPFSYLLSRLKYIIVEGSQLPNHQFFSNAYIKCLSTCTVITSVMPTNT